jgi:hypothetical protein
MAHEAFEQCELTLGELHGSLGDVDLPSGLVEDDATDSERWLVSGPLGVMAAAESAKTGTELGIGEGLDEVVISTRVEACHSVSDGIARGEHEDRQAEPFGPEGAADLQSVDVGEADVEDDDVQPVGAHGQLEAFVTSHGEFHHVVVFDEESGQRAGKANVVLDHQKMHRRDGGTASL